jgi:endonuclease G, mitochondrial
MKSIFKKIIVPFICTILLLWIGFTFVRAQTLTPIRQSVSGSCECPYDKTSIGRSCGGNSSYARSSTPTRPICYLEDQPQSQPSPSPSPSPSPTPQPSSIHLKYGNPSNARVDINEPDNYLMVKPEYTLSYNRFKGIPNWVSWQLNGSWMGDTPRQDDFRPDSSLPTGWTRITPTDYTNSGFDRGHITSSEDRGVSVATNSATFLMTNMVPQAPDNNRGPWVYLENYCRDLVTKQGKELYIVAGGSGSGGTGEKGMALSIAGGKVSVPATTWKVILVVDPETEVSETTRTIAVSMPNSQGIKLNKWQSYRVSIDEVEQATGFNFFSDIPENIQAAIESKVDNL